MNISTILSYIDLGAIALPEFRRGYVWNRDQVRELIRSLYKRFPIGSLLVWVTKTDDATHRGDQALPPGTVQLLLDGQQRVSSLYGIIRGKAPAFFEGNAQAFTGIYFNLEDETFEFYSPLKMRDDPRWVDITALMQQGAGVFIQKFVSLPEFIEKFPVYLNRLNAVDGIKHIDLHVEQVTGSDKTVDVVVDIFNRVNSGGTKLSKGDLALAKVCAGWPGARAEMNKSLEKWRGFGFDFRLELLLRCTNTVLTGEALFSALDGVETAAFREALSKAERHIDTLLNLIGVRLGLDHDRVLGSRYSFPLMARYLDQRGGKLTTHHERDKLLYWYIHTILWGRYAGSTETVLNQDLGLIAAAEEGLDRLIERLRQNRRDLRVVPDDFLGWSRGARFYPLLYMLTRVWKARDWGSGLELSRFLFGRMNQLEVHHIFPKALLYRATEYGYTRPEVNAIANLTFLTKDTNLAVSDRDPAIYLEEIASRQPQALGSHWIPMDRQLWQVDRYRDFLAARRELLAKACNEFLDSLLSGSIPEAEAPMTVVADRMPFVPVEPVADDDEQRIAAINQWVIAHSLPVGAVLFELTEPETGNALGILDLAWPDGLQPGLSDPVAEGSLLT